VVYLSSRHGSRGFVNDIRYRQRLWAAVGAIVIVFIARMVNGRRPLATRRIMSRIPRESGLVVVFLMGTWDFRTAPRPTIEWRGVRGLVGWKVVV